MVATTFDLVVLINLMVSDGTDLVGELSGSRVSNKLDVGLLVTLRSDEGVDLLHLDLVEVLNGILDSFLVGGLLAEEDDGVLLDNVHTGHRLGGNRLLNHIKEIGGILLRDGS